MTNDFTSFLHGSSSGPPFFHVLQNVLPVRRIPNPMAAYLESLSTALRTEVAKYSSRS